MIIIKIKKIIITLLFLMGTAVLFLGYSGLTGAYFQAFSLEKELLKQEESNIQSGDTNNRDTSMTYSDNMLVDDRLDSSNESFFVDYKMQREKSRSQQVELLKEIINSSSENGETKKVAQEQLLQISKNIVQETRLEYLLKANNFKEVVVCIDPEGVNVITDGDYQNANQYNELLELISRETGFGEQSIIISTKKHQ